MDIQNKFKPDITPIKEELIMNLNTAYNAELKSAYIYQHLQNCAEFIGLTGTAKYFKEASSEELEHTEKVRKFLQDLNRHPKLEGFNLKDLSQYKDMRSMFIAGLEHEKKITSLYMKLKEVAEKVGDPRICRFASDVIMEQVDEEAKFIGLLDRFDILGKGDIAIATIDTELMSNS